MKEEALGSTRRPVIAGAILIVAVAAAAGGGWAWRSGRAWPSEPRFFPLPQPGVRIWVPAVGADRHQGEVRLRGRSPVTLWLESAAALPATVFAATNLTARPIEVRCARAGATITLGPVAPQSSRKLLLTPQAADRVRRSPAGSSYLYRLRVTVVTGDGDRGDVWAGALAYLGTREFVERDLYALAWDGCGAPSPVVVGEQFLAVVRLRNLSAHPWPHRDNARVRLAYRWLAADGRVVEHRLRTELGAEIAPGAELATWQRVQAPPEPGPFRLELDPVFERVERFSSRTGGLTCRIDVDVIGSPQGAASDPAPAAPTPEENARHDHRSTQGNPSP